MDKKTGIIRNSVHLIIRNTKCKGNKYKKIKNPKYH